MPWAGPHGPRDRDVHRLFVVPTPIGNLEDITLRAVRVLGEVTVIFAEDTRHTRKLLAHHGLSTPLRSYHQYNKLSRIHSILRAVHQGDVALVSDAGMPALSDPGFELIGAAVDAGIEIDVLPGPSAAITAVVGAAIPAPGFVFLGFLPRGAGELRRELRGLSSIPWSIVMYESPHRLVGTLSAILEVLGDRRIVVARELSKLHQEYVRGTVSEALARFETEPARGECTVVLAGSQGEPEKGTEDALAELRRRRMQGQDAKTAVAEVAAGFGLQRNVVYRLWLSLGE